MQGILIGGILPALFIGLALTLLKQAGILGLSAGNTMMIISIGVFITGTVASFLFKENFSFPPKATAIALCVGLSWATGTLLMSFAVNRFGLPMSVSASLAAANALVTVTLSLLFFKEAANLHTIKLVVGALLIVSGTVMVTLAQRS